MHWSSTARLGIVTVWLSCCLVGCGGAANRWSSFQPGFNLGQNTTVTVGGIEDLAPKESRDTLDEEFEPLTELRQQLERRLSRQGLQGRQGSGPALVLKPRIMDYDPGNAFLRWWNMSGVTVLTVYCDVYQNGAKQGFIKVRRTVEFGGLYSVGQWKAIFGAIAGDIVAELKKKIAQGS